MASKKVKITLQDALRGKFGDRKNEFTEENEKLLLYDLRELRDTLEGQERVDAFIARIQRHATESVNLSVDADFKNITGGKLDHIQEVIRDMLQSCISLFISR